MKASFLFAAILCEISWLSDISPARLRPDDYETTTPQAETFGSARYATLGKSTLGN
jgi:hypothetical protein